MRALWYENNLSFHDEHPEPTMGDEECLVRVHLAGVAPTDLLIAAGRLPFRGIPGHEFVGTVEQGPATWHKRRVVCEINCACKSCAMCLSGLSNHCRRRTVIGVKDRDGCLADRLAAPVRNLHAVPDVLSDEEAVFTGALAGAFQVLTQHPIDRRTSVTIVDPGLLGLLVAQVLRTTGCAPTVVGRDPEQLEFCDKKGVQSVPVDELIPRQDRDAVIVCSVNRVNLQLALTLVRPRGVIILKDPRAVIDGHALTDVLHSAGPSPNTANAPSDTESPLTDFSSVIANEVTLVGSRCGSFPIALDALASGTVDVRSLVGRVFRFDDALEAMDYAAAPGRLHKTFLKMS